MRPVRASSTEIRRRIASGARLDDMMPATVADFIAGHALYAPVKKQP
jgi:nicotinic acid mononucleotide adenylyltransferase